MKKNSLYVIVGFLLAFGAGYLLFGQTSAQKPTTDTPPTEEQTDEQSSEDEADEEDLTSMVPEEAEVLSRNSCLGCHSVESIDVIAGDIGPDLSRVFPEMKAKHGKELDDFLQEPTSAVMSTIIADRPIDDDERTEIVELLKKAAEKKSSKESKDDAEQQDEEAQ